MPTDAKHACRSRARRRCRSALRLGKRRPSLWRCVLSRLDDADRRLCARLSALPLRPRLVQNALFSTVRQRVSQAPLALADASTWALRFGHQRPTHRAGQGAGASPFGDPLLKLDKSAAGAHPTSLCVTGDSPIHSRSVFLSLVCWMKMSCSGGSAGSAVCGLLK
jgi:hypothetical protein